MGKTFHYFLIVLISAMTISQANASEHVEYYDNGNIKSIYKYLNDNEVYFTLYYNSGEIKETGCYTDGKKDRTWISYSSNGSRTAIANYKNGLKDGKWKIFNSDGSLRYEIEYQSGEIIDLRDLSANL